MKWHKISDDDYPDIRKPVLVSMRTFSGYTADLCLVVSMQTNKDGKKYWYDCGIGEIFIRPNDRWSYIDLPTD